MIRLALAMLAACGHATTCPAPLPPHVVQLGAPERCAHARRLPVPPAPPMTGFADVDRIRVEDWARKLELFAAMDWLACDGAP